MGEGKNSGMPQDSYTGDWHNCALAKFPKKKQEGTTPPATSMNRHLTQLFDFSAGSETPFGDRHSAKQQPHPRRENFNSCYQPTRRIPNVSG